jgi:hypothetical protein
MTNARYISSIQAQVQARVGQWTGFQNMRVPSEKGKLCSARSRLLSVAAPQSFAAQQPTKAQITAVPVTRPAATELAWLRTEMAKPAERAKILEDPKPHSKASARSASVHCPAPRPSRTCDLCRDRCVRVLPGADSQRFRDRRRDPGRLVARLGPGQANNYGVWAAVYWLPQHFTDGRW